MQRDNGDAWRQGGEETDSWDSIPPLTTCFKAYRILQYKSIPDTSFTHWMIGWWVFPCYWPYLCETVCLCSSYRHLITLCLPWWTSHWNWVCSFSKGAFLMCSSEQEETESSKFWDTHPSGAAWVSVGSPLVLVSAAQMEGRAWSPAHLCSEWRLFLGFILSCASCVLEFHTAGVWKETTVFTSISQCPTVSACSCQCPLGWTGALCSETTSVCDAEHSPPPLCAHGSTCVPLPNGYTCQCPLGTAGLHCEKGCPIGPLLECCAL